MTNGSTQGVKRRRLIAWILVVRESMLPLAAALITVVVFARLEQAQEALFGTIGLAPDPSTRPFRRHIETQFLALAATILMLAVAVWYSARLLLTVDAATRTRLARVAVRRRASGIVEEFPRLLGAATAAALVTTLLSAQSGIRSNQLLIVGMGLFMTFGPLASVVYIALRFPPKSPRAASLLLAVAGAWFIIGCLLIRLTRPADRDWGVAAALSIACIVPAIFYAAVAWRRPMLRRAGFKPRAASAGLQFTLRQGILRLLLMGFLGGVTLLLLAIGPLAAARTLGSPAIVLLAVTAGLCLLCALTLVLRRLDHIRPGIVIAGVVALAAVYLVFHTAVGWHPFREQTGAECLPKVADPPTDRTLQDRAGPDVVVNAYGGGLRAALFTAQVLAELDDRTCGEFGRRLERLSGVSGGSLGIAVYLILRQELVASGGWGKCSPGPLNQPRLARMVEDVLVQDHLSAALARMLSIDLLPMLTPKRGQALLESWQHALSAQLRSREHFPSDKAVAAGLALRLRALNGGLKQAPGVFFNATRVHDGKTIWFSNHGTFGVGRSATALHPDFQVGQAVLHSARFPLVSPAGKFKANAAEMVLVDGGYADNSGAATLRDMHSQASGPIWLSIDGNSPPVCWNPQAEQAQGVFSPLDTLLAVRRSQADLAVRRFAEALGSKETVIQPILEDAFRATIEDEAKRCQRAQELRSAPLSWYLTPVTVGDQSLARLAAVNKACEALKPLCGS